MRKVENWNEEWLFSKDGIQFREVTLPHTWNAVDGQDGGNDYYRGCCIYKKRFFMPEHHFGDRVVLEVGAAANTAEVFLNGEKLCTHEGGYSCFRVDLTDALYGVNDIEIKVDNTENDRIYPQKADFTFYGGIYRDVKLITVSEKHFELIKDGTPAIKVTPVVDLERKEAVVTMESWQNADAVEFQLRAAAPAGTDPATSGALLQKIVVPSVDGYAKATFTINPVHLWDGVDDPYLYTAVARITSESYRATGVPSTPEEDEGYAHVSHILDIVSTRFGCRKMEVDPEKGFFLNGRSYPLRGVAKHQDMKAIGNATGIADWKRDMEIVKDLGANTLRLAHYQHPQGFYDLCDENGIIVWAEIPYITMHMPNGRENTLSMMKELITQCYNHPSIAVWGLSNEITAASAVDEDMLENHRLLNDLCHEMDPTRPTVMADVFMLETDSPILEIPDLNSYNLYFGWYIPGLELNDKFFDDYHAKFPNRCIGLSEYGADANPAYHAEKPERSDYTEDYQAIYHEHMVKMINARPYLWATHVWNLFDFAADGRDEGGKHGENQKGLVTFDRQTKKDAFYLYKAAWNKKDAFVHLGGKRYVDREADETEIRVYSNQPKVTLFVDGKEFGTEEGEIVFRFRVPLADVPADAEVKIEAAAGEAKDEMVIRHVAEANPDYIFAGKKASVANWVDAAENDPTCYSVEDTLGDLRENPQTAAIVNGMMEKAAASRGDVAKATQNNPMLQAMMAKMSLISLLQQGGADEESVKSLNRILQGIRKN